MHKPATLLLFDPAGAYLEPLRQKLAADVYCPSVVTEQVITEQPELFQQLAQNAADILVVGMADSAEQGLRICVAVRKRSTIPTIFLGRAIAPDAIVRSLEAGADDVVDLDRITARVLHLRLSVLLRRARQQQQHIVHRSGSVVLNPVTREVTVRGRPVTLRPLEYELLHFLITHPQQPLSKRILIEKVWDQTHENSSVVEMAVRRLRQKIEQDPSRPEHIVTQRGLGYTFV